MNTFAWMKGFSFKLNWDCKRGGGFCALLVAYFVVVALETKGAIGSTSITRRKIDNGISLFVVQVHGDCDWAGESTSLLQQADARCRQDAHFATLLVGRWL